MCMTSALNFRKSPIPGLRIFSKVNPFLKMGQDTYDKQQREEKKAAKEAEERSKMYIRNRSSRM